MRPLWRVEGRRTHTGHLSTPIYIHTSHLVFVIRTGATCQLCPVSPVLTGNARGVVRRGCAHWSGGASVSHAGLECKVIKEAVRVISLVHVTCLLLTLQLCKCQARQISRLEKYTKVASAKVFSRTYFSKPSRKTGSAGSFPFLLDYSFHH